MIWNSIAELAADSDEFKRIEGRLPTFDELVGFRIGKNSYA